MDKAYGLWNFPPEMALQLSQKLITTKEQKEMNEAVKKIDFQKKRKRFRGAPGSLQNWGTGMARCF